MVFILISARYPRGDRLVLRGKPETRARLCVIYNKPAEAWLYFPEKRARKRGNVEENATVILFSTIIFRGLQLFIRFAYVFVHDQSLSEVYVYVSYVVV